MVYFGLGNNLLKFCDPRTGEIRSSLLDDVENVARVADRLDNIDFIASLALASDVPCQLVDLYHFRALRKYSIKPILASTIFTF